LIGDVFIAISFVRMLWRQAQSLPGIVMNSTPIFLHFKLWPAVGVLASLIGMGLSHAALAVELDAVAAPAKRASRAEVIADLRLWLRAGLDQYTDSAVRDAAPGGYKQAMAKYESLRQGPAFVEEVARASRELGDSVTLSGKQTRQGVRVQ
jgi:hypothetical protein